MNSLGRRSPTMQGPVSSGRSYLSRLLPRPAWLLALTLGLASPASAQAPGTWAPIADLNQPRAEHTATLLASGTVLIAGGRDAADQPLASAEIYDPARGGYTLLASPLPAPVWGHTATRLDAGSVLIAGGQRAARYRRTAKLFDPASDTFAALPPMSTPRGRHTATLLRDGRVVVIGGTDGVGPLASLEIYDPTTRTFSLAPTALAVALQGHTATLVPDGPVLVAGGSDSSGALESAELYDPTAGTVSPARPLNVTRTLASAALLLDGKVLVAGGPTTTSEDLDSAEVYDAATNAFPWLASPMETARSGHLGVQLLHNGKVLISGGTSGGQLVPSAEVYDPVTGAFQPVDSPGTARRLFGANFFEVPYTGILLATGGLDGAETPLASSEVFFYPTLRSDKPDYAPGETVTLMGEGWRPNEQVAINIRESSGDPDTNLTATADTSGAFTNSEFQTNPDRSDVGVRFLATATTTGTKTWTTSAFANQSCSPGQAFTNVPPQPSVTVSAPPTLAINDVSQNEGNSGTTPFVFTVSLSSSSSQTVTVSYATADGTATTADNDYVAANGTLTFNPGDTTKTITVNVNGDTKFEPNETFFVNLSGATNATIAKAVGTGTIQNDDTQPALSIDDVVKPEGTTSSTPPGTTAFPFTVSLSNASSQTITVNYATGNVSAIGNTSCAGSNSGSPDYISQSGTLTFAPGETSKPVTVLVCADTAFEPDETFTVTLSGATNATIAKAIGTGTIQNDDAPAVLSIDDVVKPEGTTSSTPPGTTAFPFTVSLSNPSGQTITVNYATGNVSAIGNTSCAGSNSGSPDYISQSGTLTFAPGETSKPVTVLVCADTAFEPDETFTVTLSGATNATIAKGTGTGTIQNDYSQPALSLDDVVKPEGTTSSPPPGTTAFPFTVSLSNPSGQTITVNYATGNVSAIGNTSCAGSNSGSPDYISQSGTLTFAPGETSKPVTVLVCADTAFEPDETFTVTLSGATNATIAKGTGTGTIQNDYSQPALSLDDVVKPEGTTSSPPPGTTAFPFTVSLSNASSQTITV